MKRALRFLACAAFALGMCAAATPAASAGSCPRANRIDTTDGTTYVVTFSAENPFAGSVEARFYTATAEYTATIPALAIDEPAKLGLRSKDVAFWNPGSEPLLGVSFDYRGTVDGGTCTERSLIVRHATGSARERRQARVGGPAPDPGTIPLVLAAGSSPLPCAQPFVPARVHGYPANAVYPAIAREEGVTGVVQISVEIGVDGTVGKTTVFRSSGNQLLDDSALTAAEQTRYDPEIFRCEPQAGTYLFRVDFTGPGR